MEGIEGQAISDGGQAVPTEKAREQDPGAERSRSARLFATALLTWESITCLVFGMVLPLLSTAVVIILDVPPVAATILVSSSVAASGWWLRHGVGLALELYRAQ